MTAPIRPIDSHLAEEYEAALRAYLTGIGEAALERAYELGRKALAANLGVLDMVRFHHAALRCVSPPWPPSEDMLRGAERLLVESLTPFEMTHRGFREANAALRTSEERYRELFENANDILFTTDLEGRFSSINRAGERVSGYERGQIVSRHFSCVVAPEYLETARRARETKLAGRDEGTRYEVELLTADGRRVPVEVSTRLMFRQGVPVGVQGIARDITERKLAELAMRRVNERLEEEAKRIAHALHDEAGQLLASVHLAVEELAGELPAARGRLTRIRDLLDQVGKELRSLSHELRPIILDDFGLAAALRLLAQGVSKRTGLAVAVDCPTEERFPPAVETAVYRVVQEALTNASRHARARTVTVRLAMEAHAVACSIRDDGTGFDPSARCLRGQNSGLGLIGIRERLAGVNGTLAITSAPGQGTALDITIPLDGCRWDRRAVRRSGTDEPTSTRQPGDDLA